jgi:hypothetical protein
MEKRHSAVDIEIIEGAVQRLRDALGVPDERLHLRLAEVASRRAGEAAAESLHTGYAKALISRAQNEARSFEYNCAHRGQLVLDGLLLVLVVVVIAENCDHRDLDLLQLRGKNLRLGKSTDSRQVSGEEQNISALVCLGKTDATDAVLADMNVAHSRNPDHRLMSVM